MIKIEIDEARAPEVARVHVSGKGEFKGTIPTRVLAENLLTNVALVKSVRGEGWINLLGTPAHTAWKFQPSGALQAITYFPPRVVEMLCVHPFARDFNTREFAPAEVCKRPYRLPGSVWTGAWNPKGQFIKGAFMLSEEPNPGDFLNTSTFSFDYGNVYETGQLCWGQAAPRPAAGNLYTLDTFFFQESVNNYHISRGEGAGWWQGFGFPNSDAWRLAVRGEDARGRALPGGRPQLPLSWEQARALLPNLPAEVVVARGAFRGTISGMLAAEY